MNGLQVTCSSLSRVFGLLLFFSLLVSPVIARDVLHAVNPAGSTPLSFKDVSGGLIKVTVTQSKLDSSYPYRNALLWGGDKGALPQSIVSGIEIQKDNETIFVPLSAYGDLGDVKSVSFNALARGFRVSLHGGNTAASYDATLFFERGLLTRRDVRLRELPDARWEKTMYAFPRRAQE
jgi:hypothetical protein